MGTITKINPSSLLGPLTDAARKFAPEAFFLLGDPGVFSFGTGAVGTSSARSERCSS